MSLSLLAGRTVDITRIVAEANKYKAGGGGGGGGGNLAKKNVDAMHQKQILPLTLSCDLDL